MKSSVYKHLGFILIVFFIWMSQAHAQRYWNVAAKFDGSAQSYIAVNPWYIVKDLTGSFTVECWFNCQGSGTQTLFGKDGFRLLLEPTGTDRVMGRMQTSSNTKLYSRAFGMEKNKWYHLACSYDMTGTGLMSFYINGVYDTSTAGSNIGAIAGTDSLFIGKSVYGSFQGMLDDIRVWNSALSGAEIAVNMRNPYVGVLNYSTPNFNAACIMATSFDFTYAGTSQLYLYDGYNTYMAYGVNPYYLGGHPSQTLVINSALDVTNGGYAAMPTNADIELTGALTMEAWIYPTLASTDVRYIIAKKAGWNDPGYAVYYSIMGGIPVIRFKTDGAGFISNSAVPLNQWTHIAATIAQTGDAKIYINGLLDNESGLNLPGANSDSLYIGNIKDGTSSDGFVGYIDAVKISNYEKSQQEIASGMNRLVEVSNRPAPPNSTVSLNFDYIGFSTTATGGSYYCKGNAKYSSPAAFSGVPVSPILGSNVNTFPGGYFVKSSNRRIPAFSTAGYMMDDSISISYAAPLSDVKLFIGLNHTRLADLVITLMAPTGDSVVVWNQQQGVSPNIQSIVTIFDDAAPDALVSGIYADFSPEIQPLNPLNAAFSGKNPQGTWRLKITDLYNGNTGFLYSWGLSLNNINGINDGSTTQAPGNYQLEQNYPNPFNPTTTINYSIKKEGNVKLTVYNVVGSKVATIINEYKPAGSYSIQFNGSNLASGIYLYRLESGNYSVAKKFILLK